MSDSTLTNPLLRTLREGGLAASLIVRLFDGPEIGRIAATAGLDALYVDLEHSPVAAIRQPHLQRHPRGGRDAAGARAAIDAALIGRVLDGGALGIIAPQVESAADAARVVACCRHPPRGRRSYAGGQAALGYRDLPQAEAMAALDASVLTAVMIESRNALDAVEAIASVDGLDLLFIGAHDLAADLGLAGQWDHRRCCERWPASARPAWMRARRWPGRSGGPARAAARTGRPPLGCLVSTGTDLACLLGAATQRAAAAHALRDRLAQTLQQSHSSTSLTTLRGARPAGRSRRPPSHRGRPPWPGPRRRRRPRPAGDQHAPRAHMVQEVRRHRSPTTVTERTLAGRPFWRSPASMHERTISAAVSAGRHSSASRQSTAKKSSSLRTAPAASGSRLTQRCRLRDSRIMMRGSSRRRARPASARAR